MLTMPLRLALRPRRRDILFSSSSSSRWHDGPARSEAEAEAEAELARAYRMKAMEKTGSAVSREKEKQKGMAEPVVLENCSHNSSQDRYYYRFCRRNVSMPAHARLQLRRKCI